MGLVFDFVYPPIPVRHHDWQVSIADDPEYGSVGEGRTKQAAALDALENWEPIE
jgi:hypothetical protein